LGGNVDMSFRGDGDRLSPFAPLEGFFHRRFMDNVSWPPRRAMKL
jgi:hypothetical protein